jgi:hypothetical protein
MGGDLTADQLGSLTLVNWPKSLYSFATRDTPPPPRIAAIYFPFKRRVCDCRQLHSIQQNKTFYPAVCLTIDRPLNFVELHPRSALV